MLSGNVTTQLKISGIAPLELPLYRVKDGNVLLIEGVKVYADPVDENTKLAGTFPVSKYAFSLHLKENGITKADFTTLNPSIKPPAYRKLANYQKIVLRGFISVEVFPKEEIPSDSPLTVTVVVEGHELPENHPLVEKYLPAAAQL